MPTSHSSRAGLLTGPPPTLPAVLDALADRWWRLSPRARLAACLIGAGLAVAAALGFLAQAPGGPPVSVIVAGRPLLPGEVIAADDLRRIDWPVDLTPQGAHTATGPLVGATIRALVPAGAPLTDDHLGDDAVVAGLPAGLVAVPVELDRLPTLAPGARIDVVGGGFDGVGRTLASGGVVIATDATHIWLGIDPAAAADVAAAAGAGALGVVVTAHNADRSSLEP